MRKRSLAASIFSLSAAAILLAGCSGKPENSPAIRKKFAEFDQVQKSVETMTTELESMKGEVARLTQENSELRTFLPTVDGDSAVSKLQAIEARLNKVEGLSADRVLGSATTTTRRSDSAQVTSSTRGTSEPLALDTAPLAGVLNKPSKPATSSEAFKQMTSPKKETSSKSSTTAKATAKKETEKKTTAQKTTKKSDAPAKATKAPVVQAAAVKRPSASESKPSASRGAYHTIATGETIATISAKYGVSAERIMKENKIPTGVRLARGQRLFIPPAN